MMITNARIPISLSGSLVSELAAFNTSGDISEFIEKAVVIQTLKKQERIQRDREIINANAERFNRDAEGAVSVPP
jgi:hypothetical protein